MRAITTATTEDTITIRARRRGSSTVVTELGGSEPWQPRLLGCDGRLARVAFVQTRASLLAGDAVALVIDVGDGCALELVELGATLAHHVRGGVAARVAVDLRVGIGARLVWLAQPLIAAAGCRVERSTSVALAPAAAVLLRETIVLGRAGEQPVRVCTHIRVTIAGRPALEETLDTDPRWLLRSGVVAAGATVIDSLTLAGLRDVAAPPGALQAHAPATIHRALGDAPLDPSVCGRWRRLVLDAAQPV